MNDGGKQTEGKTVDPQTGVFKRAVRDAKEAHEVAKQLVKSNQTRNQKAARIAAKLNGEAPWSQKALKATGQNWRHNRSTGFMSGMISRVIPSYKQTIDATRLLTNSKLRSSGLEQDQKVDDFRKTTTETFRGWSGWDTFTYQTVNENVTYGYAAVTWPDEWDWRPVFLRQDEAFFPDGCPQTAKDVPLWSRRQSFLIHELAAKIADPQIASETGWNVDNVVKAVNRAQPKKSTGKAGEDERRRQDAVRETTVGDSYKHGVKVIEALHLYVQEANGKVSHFLVDEATGDDLFVRYDRYESMDECLALFSVEIGNGKLHGSRGAGRILFNTHVGIEQARNLISDALYLSGMLILRNVGAKKKAAITVQHPVCVVEEGYEPVKERFNIDAEAFFALDRHLTQIAELQIGAFMPGQILDESGEKRTASEINYTAQTEQQIREGVLRRFWTQFMALVWQMQKRMYSPENIAEALQIIALEEKGRRIITRIVAKLMAFLGIAQDKNTVIDEEIPDEVLACKQLLLAGLKPEEIYELAQSSPGSGTSEALAQDAQALDLVVQRYMLDPNVDKLKLIQRDIAQKLGNRVADDLVLKGVDQTVQAEAVRLQIMEIACLLAGDAVPVSPRDEDTIHLQVIMDKASSLIQSLKPETVTSQVIGGAKALVAHADEHVQNAVVKKVDAKALQPFMEWLQMAHAVLDPIKIAPQGLPAGAVSAPAGGGTAVGPGGTVPVAGAKDVLAGEDPAGAASGGQPIPPGQPGGMPLAQGPGKS